MKKSIIFILSSVLFFASCGEEKVPETEDLAVSGTDLVVEPDVHIGLITPETCSRKAVLAAYGKNAKVDQVYLTDLLYKEGVIVYPDIPRRRMEIYWDNESDTIRPMFIRIIGDSTGTDWKTSDGVTIGTPISEVQRLNGKPFFINGFGVPYSGFALGWNGGKFSTSVLFRFMPTENGLGMEKIQGEGGFSSDQPEVLAAKPKVSSMLFRFLTKEKLPDCMMEKIETHKVSPNRLKIYTMKVDGLDHYWLVSGAAASGGTEFIYDANCKEVCKTQGEEKPLDCMKAYQKGRWKLFWEE